MNLWICTNKKKLLLIENTENDTKDAILSFFFNYAQLWAYKDDLNNWLQLDNFSTKTFVTECYFIRKEVKYIIITHWLNVFCMNTLLLVMTLYKQFNLIKLKKNYLWGQTMMTFIALWE